MKKILILLLALPALAAPFRFTVTNERDGRTFVVEGDSFPPAGLQPEWGQPARTKLKEDCDAFELGRIVKEHEPDPETGKVSVDLPDDFRVVPVDLAPEIAAAEARKAEALARRERIKGADLTTVPPAFRPLIQDLISEVREMVRF